MKQIVLMIGLMALVGCGKNKPVPPKKAKATAGVKLWEFETGGDVESSHYNASPRPRYYG